MEHWNSATVALMSMIRKWLSGFTPTTGITSVVDENGTSYDITLGLSALIREKISFDSTSNRFDLEWARIFWSVDRHGEPTRFPLIKGVKLWRTMTGDDLKKSKRVLDLAAIAFEAGKEIGRDEMRVELGAPPSCAKPYEER